MSFRYLITAFAGLIPALHPTLAEPATLSSPLVEGQKIYMQVCFACHQPTGLGLPNLFPPLAGSDWVNAPKPDRLIRIVLHGMTGPVKINRVPFQSPAPLMPPQGAALTDSQIADVLSYVRATFGERTYETKRNANKMCSPTCARLLANNSSPSLPKT